MPRQVRLRELLVGVEGLALLRQLFGGDDESAAARVEEVRRIVAAEDGPYSAGSEVPELDVRAGYAAWSETYDRPGNPLIAVEQPAIWAILDAIPPGFALDAACGTGRHARRLAARGHRVTGADLTAEMLAVARAAVPEASFVQADLAALPFPTGRFDLAVCALAMDHQLLVGPAVGELARVVGPGGRVLLSELHPVATHVGGAPYFRGADGSSGVVTAYRHLHGEYLRAFEAAGLRVRQCLEPAYGPEEVAMQQPAWRFAPEATTAAFLGLPAALIWDLARG